MDKVRVLHSDLKQRDGQQALQDFKDGKVKILSAQMLRHEDWTFQMLPCYQL